MSFNDEFKKLLGTFEKLESAVLELFEVLLLQLVQTGLKDVLLIVLMSKSHQQKQVICRNIFDHILFQVLQKTLNL